MVSEGVFAFANLVNLKSETGLIGCVNRANSYCSLDTS